MSDRPASLEAQLHELSRLLDLPPAPDVSTAVRIRLQRKTPNAWRPRLYRVAAAFAALVVLVSVSAALSPQVRAAITDVLRIFGVAVHQGTSPAPPGQGTLPGETRVTLDEALRLAPFSVHVPPALGTPDIVTVADGPVPRVVSLIYEPGIERPSPSGGVGAIRLDEFDGRVDQTLFEKYVVTGSGERVSVGGRPGLWVTGPHDLLYVDRSGRVREEAARLAANTLIWEIDGVTLRLEGDFTRDGAVAIAAATR